MGLQEVSGKTEPAAPARAHLERLVNKVAPKEEMGAVVGCVMGFGQEVGGESKVWRRGGLENEKGVGGSDRH